jgi:Protein of unknown function (DUF3617)
MSLGCRVTVIATTLFAASFMACAAFADGIDPGLWKIISRTATGGVIGPPHESSKCLTADQARDLATTFSPIPSTVNSVCAPIERSLNGQRLTWRLTCKGHFDTSRHYTATVRTQAAMGGMQMVDSQDTLEAQWVSECSQ